MVDAKGIEGNLTHAVLKSLFYTEDEVRKIEKKVMKRDCNKSQHETTEKIVFALCCWAFRQILILC